nr:MAG TPA: hypothetical protein [Caudoviricetes sp.]
MHISKNFYDIVIYLQRCDIFILTILNFTKHERVYRN